MLDLLRIGGAKTWMTPEIIQINRLPSRATAYPFPNARQAQANAGRETSPWYLPLNGEWDFHLAQKPEDVPAEFIQPDFAPSNNASWMKMPVPGNWTLHGTFDRPHYLNMKMPFPDEPPHVPEKNPTGCYRTVLDLPASWQGRRIVLHFGGAESVLYLYVNGQPVGILNVPGVQTLTFGTGGTPTFAEIVKFETLIAQANADIGELSWLTSPGVRGNMKTTARTLTGATVVGVTPVWDEDEMNGYETAGVTQNVPNNLLALGVGSEFIHAIWSGIDLVVNPYSLDTSGQIRITVQMWVDNGVRHELAFCVSTNNAA